MKGAGNKRDQHDVAQDERQPFRQVHLKSRAAAVAAWPSNLVSIVIGVGASRRILDIHQAAGTERLRIGDKALLGVGDAGALGPAVATRIGGAAVNADESAERRARLRGARPEQDDPTE